MASTAARVVSVQWCSLANCCRVMARPTVRVLVPAGAGAGPGTGLGAVGGVTVVKLWLTNWGTWEASVVSPVSVPELAELPDVRARYSDQPMMTAATMSTHTHVGSGPIFRLRGLRSPGPPPEGEA